MKKIFVLFILLTASTAFAQIYKDLPNEVFLSKEDYTNREDQVLEVSKFILSNPIVKDNLDRVYAMQFLLKWMEGTPDYKFTIGETIMSLTGGDLDLMGVYFAAVCETAIQNKNSGKTDEQTNEEAIKKFVTYAADKGNNVKANKELKKAIKNLE
jgi:hypothetical protein